MQLHIDADALVAGYGGTSGFIEHFKKHGYRVSRQSLSKWRLGRMIPMRAWLRIYEIELKDGTRLDLRAYIKGGK